MDLGTIIIGIVLIALCSLPFFYMRKNDKENLKILRALAKGQSCEISVYEISGNLIIGMDETKKILFFIKKIQNSEIVQTVDLNTISGCEIIKSGKSINSKNSSYSVIEKLTLQFHNKVKGKEEQNIDFFDSEENVHLSGELQTIQNWEKQINELIKK